MKGAPVRPISVTIVDPLRSSQPAVWSRRALRDLDAAARLLEGVAFAALMDPRGAELELVGLCTRALDTLHTLGARSDEAPPDLDRPREESVARAGALLLGIDPTVIDRPADRDRLGRVIAELSAYRRP